MLNVDDHADDGVFPEGVLRIDRQQYRGKHYQVPIFDVARAVILTAAPARARHAPDAASQPVLDGLNGTWDIRAFLRPRRPVSLGTLDDAELAVFARPGVQAPSPEDFRA